MADPKRARYTLERELGSGAMGEVWLATDNLLGRSVAIKYLRATQDKRPKELFQSEAKTLASLNHPNITSIYDAMFDEAADRFFLVMEYVEGMTLADVINQWDGPLPVEMVLDSAIGILEALRYAHARDVVHRDIKPANVIMQKEGVKLTDFGVAGLMSLLTEGSDYIVGTPSYLPPEQIETGIVDGRSDLYSFGVMLFEMLSGGVMPFTGKDRDSLFDAHVEQPPPAIHDFAPELPVALAQVLMRLLAKKPQARFPTAAEVIDVLTAIRARQQLSQPHLELLDADTRPFIGCETPLQTMAQRWESVQEHAQPHLLVLKGEMGSGKSRLATEFLGRHVVDTGLKAVVGRCDESGVPFAPYATILATILNKGLSKHTPSQAQIAQLTEQIPSLARLLDLRHEIDPTPSKDSSAEFKRVISESTGGLWKTLIDRVPSSAASEHTTQVQWQFFDTVLDILAGCEAVVLFLEDGLFIDEASAALSRFLIRQGQIPLLIITTYRTLDQSAAWLDMLHPEEKTLVTLPPLTEAETRDYLTNWLAGDIPAAAAQHIYEQSKGNPLAVEAITRQLIDAGELHRADSGAWQYTPPKEETLDDAFLPQAVLGAFTRRIEKLSPSAREALAIATLVEQGAEFETSIWYKLLAGGEAVGQDALKEGEEGRILRKVGQNRYAFRPPDVAKALAQELTGSRRREFHAQIAKILQKEKADPILVSYHLEQAGREHKAARYLEAAGAQAMSSKATNAAIAYYNKAVTMAETRSAYEALGHLYREQGQKAASIDKLRRGLELAKENGNSTDQARILNSLSLTFWLNDRYKDAYRHAANVLNMKDVAPTEQAIAQAHLGMIAWLMGQLSEAEVWCQKAVLLLKNSSDQRTLAETYYRLGMVHISQSKLSEAVADFENALRLHENAEDEIGRSHAENNLAKIAIMRGEFAEAAAQLDTLQQRFEAAHDRDGLIAVLVNQGLLRLYLTEAESALTSLTKALNLALDIGKRNAYQLSEIYRLIAEASLTRDEEQLALSAAEDSLRLVSEVSNREFIAEARRVLGQVYAAQHELEAAEEQYQQALALFDEMGNRVGLARTLMAYARFLTQQGQEETASTIADEAREEAERLSLYLPRE